jgi:alanine-synthesizing transaminase
MGVFVNFSSRLPGDLSHNGLAEALENMKKPYLDLSESNPTACGFAYGKELLERLTHPENLLYEPAPFGLPSARKAVAGYLSSRGAPVDPERVILTSGTSEAYSFLMKLLGNPGDCFLVPTPGYPLLDHLLRLEGMEPLPYPLLARPGWPMDRDGLKRTLRKDARALVLIEPHHPTGTVLSPQDREFVEALCREREMVLIRDEVFSDFVYEKAVPTRVRTEKGILSVCLGGLSKSLGLPQFKLSWMVLGGPGEVVDSCKQRLELIADCYLSVSTPVQRALPEIFRAAPEFQGQVLERVGSNRETLSRALAPLRGVRLWPSQGGWYALVEVPGEPGGDERIVLDLVKTREVFVQPGALYDFPEKNFLVVSLLPEPDVFKAGAGRMVAFLAEKFGNDGPPSGGGG